MTKKKKSTHTYCYNESGKKAGVLMDKSDLRKLIGELEDLSDIYVAQQRTLSRSKSIPLDVVKRELLKK